MTFDPNQVLLWEAFRYVASEMSSDEAEAFEQRLERDQQAREAVAAAVELAGAVALQPSARRSIARRRSLGKVVLAGIVSMAACLALAFGVRLFTHSERETEVASQNRGREADTRALVLTWSDLRQRGEAEPESGDDLIAWHDGESSGDPETGEASDMAFPSWMLEAATLRGSRGIGGPETKEN
jgi:hypothetical protein